MKTKFLKTAKMAVVVWLIALSGCTNQSAQQSQPKTVTAPPAPTVVSAPAPAPAIQPQTAVADAAAVPPAVSPEPVIERHVEQAAPPSETRISPAAAEVVKMAQAGVGEDVMISYVESASLPFNLSSDGIIYLTDLGVSAAVVTAMIKKDTQAAPGGAVPVAPTLIQTQAVSNVPATAEVPDQPAPAVAPPPTVQTQVVYVTQPVVDPTVSYFYEPLAPYGSWMYVSGYGWCWRPTVSVTRVGWRPYCDAGRWYWSDGGWYWHSDYSWGWAPFHYGRWFHHGHAGWVWCPDRVWGPSWVSWRYTQGYCGWAPLPPAAHWSVGVGFTWYGSSVGVSFGFGLSDFHYAWIPTRHFSHHNPRYYCEPNDRGRHHYGNSTVINNYVVGNNNTIINNGVGHQTISQQVEKPVPSLTIRDQSAAIGSSVKPGSITRDGAALVVHRPRPVDASLAGPAPSKPTISGGAVGKPNSASITGNNFSGSGKPSVVPQDPSKPTFSGVVKPGAPVSVNKPAVAKPSEPSPAVSSSSKPVYIRPADTKPSGTMVTKPSFTQPSSSPAVKPTGPAPSGEAKPGPVSTPPAAPKPVVSEPAAKPSFSAPANKPAEKPSSGIYIGPRVSNVPQSAPPAAAAKPLPPQTKPQSSAPVSSFTPSYKPAAPTQPVRVERDTPKPSYVAPSTPSPSRAYSAPVSRPPSTFHQPAVSQPSYSAPSPKPSYSAPSPSFSAPKPSYSAPAPSSPSRQGSTGSPSGKSKDR